jgi:serine/threonine protein kinase
MSNRVPLQNGAIVKSNVDYIIDSTLGMGANCIVYAAHFFDSIGAQKRIVLKECYPLSASISREAEKLIWEDESEAQAAFERMDKSYGLQNKVQNSTVTNDISVYSIDRIEANNTIYIATIPNSGIVYEKDSSKDINDIIKTALALTKAVGLYHELGYLHLDIKPSNFIANTDSTGRGKNIILFDIDTLVSINELKRGGISSVSFSKEWASPEQSLQKIKKICPATDIFSIGAILFERIMNRPFNNDDLAPFASWEYDNRFDARKINPKVKRLLTEIFHKTLAANVKRRYQTTAELSGMLSNVLDILEASEPYIIPQLPLESCAFVGRERETQLIKSSLEEDGKVFVSGSGGIGKSELVKHFISVHGEDYDSIVFLTYRGSVSDVINQIRVKGISNREDKRIILPELCDDKVLIILDNFDVSTDEDNSLNELLILNCDTIITTRTDFSEAYPNIRQIDLYGLSADELREVFENESDIILSDDEFEILKPILYIGRECTYFWSLLAQTVKNGYYSVSEIVEKVEAGLTALDKTENVLSNKDGIRIKQTVANAISTLFQLSKLSSLDINILEAFYYLDCLNLTQKQWKELFESYLPYPVTECMNHLNDLLERRYITKFDYDSLSVLRISDVMSEAIGYSRNPEIKDHSFIMNFINDKFYKSKDFLSSIDYKENALQQNAAYCFDCIFSIFSSVKVTSSSDLSFWIGLFYNMIGGYESAFSFAFNSHISDVIKRLSTEKNDPNLSALDRIKIRIVLSSYYSCSCRQDFFETNNDAFCNAKILEELFYETLDIINHSDINGKEELINELCMPIVDQVCSTRIRNLFTPRIIEKIAQLNPKCIHNRSYCFSFEVRALRNTSYEKVYLSNLIKSVYGLSFEDKKRIVCDGLIKILHNGITIERNISDELKELRQEALLICSDIIVERAKNDYYSPILYPGLQMYFSSVGKEIDDFDEEIEDKNDISNDNKDSVVAFRDSSFSIKKSNNPAYVLGEIKLSHFVFLVNLAIDDRAERCKSDSLEDIFEEQETELIEQYKSIVNELQNPEIIKFFPYYTDFECVSLLQFKIQFYSAASLMFCVLGEEDTAKEKLGTLLDLTTEYVNTIGYSALLDPDIEPESDKDMYFTMTINVMNNNGFATTALPYLLKHVHTIESGLPTDDSFFNDQNSLEEYETEDLHGILLYYEQLIRVAKNALIDLKTKNKLLCAIFGSDNKDLISSINSVKDIIERYSQKYRWIIGQEFHP